MKYLTKLILKSSAEQVITVHIVLLIMLLILVNTGTAQIMPNVLEGQCTDKNGTGISYAQIRILNGSELIAGDIADVQGKFHLEWPKKQNLTMEISALGYKTKIMSPKSGKLILEGTSYQLAMFTVALYDESTFPIKYPESCGCRAFEEAYIDHTYHSSERIINCQHGYHKFIPVRKKQHSKTVKSINSSKSMIYPNPTTGPLTILSNLTKRDVNIFDAQGRIVQINQLSQKGTNELNISNLKKGVYFIQFETDHNMKFEKIVLEK
ncbi:MAG: T9SS type A sorting domain-containing protein [Flavobacteriales bacterium]|nr:T9SS type A sorting domain-containing protein [Flavobacteriales bacterium]